MIVQQKYSNRFETKFYSMVKILCYNVAEILNSYVCVQNPISISVIQPKHDWNKQETNEP